jgi:hypothetical protein
MTRTTCVLLWTTLAMFVAGTAVAQVFQFRVPVETERGEHFAFLWIPHEAEQVRGIVMGGMTLAERELVRDEIIRAACADQRLALVFLTCGLGAVDIQKVLDDLAKVSGYRELSMAPLFFVGHSAGGPQAKARARQMPERCFGLMQYRGGVPGGGDALPPGIPALMMVGQFDEFGGLMRDEDGREGAWERGRDGVAAYRAQDPRHLASIVVEPGAGHFAWSQRNAEYLALFIRKAAAAMIPKRWPIDAAEPIKVNAIDPTTGWLTDLTIRTAGEHPPAAYAEFTGDRARAAWHFDREMALATVAYHQGIGRRDQFIRWTDRYWVDAGARFFFTSPTWVEDGQTLRVHPVYADKYPGQHGGHGPRWLQAGEPVEHSKAPIRLKVVGGPLVVTGPDTLRIRYHALAPAGDAGRMTFMAYSAGDETYRHTEQVGMMPRGFRGHNRGRDQTITFTAPPNLKTNAAPLELHATTDADRKVEFYVAYGPAAVVDGNKLVITELPARATFPIEVKVVAWQFGSGIAPQVKTANPVEHKLLIEKP